MTIHTDFQLSEILWYKIGGKAKYFIEAGTKDDVYQALDFIQKNHIQKVFVCGLGANLLFTDDYFDGAVIRIATENAGQTIIYNDDQVSVFAGEILDTLITSSFEHHLLGLEWAGGLPGTVGAGVRGNVGAFGGEIKDTIKNAEVLRFESGKIDTLQMSNADLDFSYRSSHIKKQKNQIVLSATFTLEKTDRQGGEQARKVYQEHIDYREKNHPHDFPNTGSTFKNIKESENVAKVLSAFPDIQDLVTSKWHGKISVGYLNKRLGFSGYQIGKAKVSEKHANFIDNIGGAKATDVIGVIQTIQGEYQETFGFSPEPEVEIVS